MPSAVIALREMQRLSLERGAYPADWKLEQPGQNPVMIPVDAAGADALFDAFAALPGLRTERMLAELADDKTLSVVIWERRSMRPASTLLH